MDLSTMEIQNDLEEFLEQAKGLEKNSKEYFQMFYILKGMFIATELNKKNNNEVEK